ncbi:MAG: nucleoside-triphosphatase [Ignavibacteriaceae bacterium]|jgi:nucleoside-triphosphatase THEP1
MSDVFIYTGEKGIGKSTYIQERFLQKPGVCGILQPRIDGIKYLVDVVSGEKKRLELDPLHPQEEVITIGNYAFSKEIFRWGRQKLSEAASSANNLLIVDEIGPLELSSTGLEPELTMVIQSGLNSGKNLLLVVRPKLIEEVKEKYGLTNPVVISYGEQFHLGIEL